MNIEVHTLHHSEQFYLSGVGKNLSYDLAEQHFVVLSKKKKKPLS